MRLICALLLVAAHHCHADYVAAVVEYNSLPGPAPNLTLEVNLKNYIYYIEQAKGFGVQLIVFPEYGLTGFVNDVENYAIPVPDVGTSNFANESFILLSLSNAAASHQLYVVVNLLEQVNGTNNTYYNTNLVFASNGTLIARYRKINLYEEPNVTPGNEVVTFTTDFGTFGLFTCADILFYNPSKTVLINTGVTDVVFPTAWFSYLPFYMSLDVQVGYALANRVNLLAANINRPSNGSGGSSIVSSDGTVLRRILTDTPASNIVFANVKPPNSVSRNFGLNSFDIFRNDTREELSNYKNLTAFEYNSYVFKPLDLSSENVTADICHADFCCNFNVVAFQNETNSSEVYKLVAYNGRTKYDTKEVGIKFCNLVACLNQDVASCGVRPPSSYTTLFRQITVWGNWEARPEEFYRPTTLRGNLEPVYNTTYIESSTNETIGISFKTDRSSNNVVLFGLLVQSGVESFGISLVLVAVLVALQGLF